MTTMRCSLCKKNDATIHYTEVVDNAMRKIHLCEACAREKGINIELPFSFSDIMSALTQGLQSLQAGGEEEPGAPTLACPLCGLTLKQLVKQGRLGCQQCYEVFDRALRDIVRSVQKAPQHVGKQPAHAHSSLSAPLRIAELELALAKAVAEERYEDCAPLRDELRRLKADPEAAP
jgi:protein arginine kinase activator